MQEVSARATKIFSDKTPDSIGSIDLGRDRMVKFLSDSITAFAGFNFPVNKSQGFRYYSGNGFFNRADGLALYAIVSAFKPKRIIEVGSGFSSALMLDMRDRFKEHPMNLTFIEPYPDRLNSLLTADDKRHSLVVVQKVQDVPCAAFEVLGENDLLFIDSSHVSKIGSDLNYLLFEILPLLKKGVIIHFHDIFYPFEYPREWIEQGIAWNEIYLLRAFLMNNSDYRIVLFNNFIGKDEALNLLYPDLATGGSLYLQKIR